jgi:DNA-binding FadR family transcriptional regulator
MNQDIYSNIQIEFDGAGPLSQKLADKLRALIMSNQLGEGSRLPSERELSEKVKLSRTVVREALNRLKGEGLLKVQPSLRAFVSRPDANIFGTYLRGIDEPKSKIFRDAQKLRLTLEPAITRLAAQRASAEQIEQLRQTVEKMEELLEDGEQFIHLDTAFHTILAEASNNQVLLILTQSIQDTLEKIRSIILASPGVTQRANLHHRMILQAIQDRDPEKADRAMLAHLHQVQGDIDQIPERMD